MTITAAQAGFMALQAHRILATHQRETAARPASDTAAETNTISADVAQLAKNLIDLADTISDLEFEVNRLAGNLPPLPKTAQAGHLVLAGEPVSAMNPVSALYYGYRGARYHILLADCSPLADRANQGDPSALLSLVTRCNARASEIMRLADAAHAKDRTSGPPPSR